MRIYEGGDFSAKQEHLQQIITMGQKQKMLHFSLYDCCLWLLLQQNVKETHGSIRQQTLTFHATAILLERVAS